MDVEKLLHALNNDNNEAIIDLDYATIAKEKNDILQRLNIPRERLKQMTKTLKAYRYVEKIEHIRYGSYIRWISLKNPDPVLTTTQEAGVGGIRSCLFRKIEARPRSPPVNLWGNVEPHPDGTCGAISLALRKGDG